jgi:hypothetical protein
MFSRKPKETAATAPEKADVRLEGARGWLDGMLSAELERLDSAASGLCDNAMAKIESLRSAMKELGRQSFDPQDKTYARVNMAKDTFVNRSLSVLSGVRKPAKTDDYKGLFAFRQCASSAVDEIKMATPKQAFLISNYFKKNASAIIEAAKAADAAIGSLDTFLGGEGSLLRRHADAAGSITVLESAVEDAGAKEAESAELSSRIESAGVRITAKEKELDILLKSGQWQSNIMAMEKVRLAAGKAKAVEQEANSMLSVLRRPMKKLSHDRKMRDLPDNPFKDIVVSGGSVEDMVRGVLSAADSHGIDLKPSEREKIVSLSGSLGEIYRLRAEYVKALAETDEAARSVDTGLEERKAAMEAEIADLRSRVERARKALGTIADETKRKREEIERRRREACGALQEATGKEVSIAVPGDSGSP